MPFGDVKGAGSRRRLALLHSRNVFELATERTLGGRRTVDALFRNALYTRNTVVSRFEWKGRGGSEQLAVVTRRTSGHKTRATGAFSNLFYVNYHKGKRDL